ncbi:NADP-dependent glyceraldehyde-3-phosphate dehydrogenase [Halobacillus naozhouensis]|uniref:NADP-dependent glyceraldehyde-3-phosphate dehydrogenase n=1 Tax=Halobacillus naozhouensis TaxID=554880 RepID=A0ABY8IX34_9BACI|nr:NADP-dependent glyceraldehyde-3-phosphate dehydrogenase [Halobacillus naozhouensis]WFT73902.1 NADP-dependent glyceraldehyde-3-phosphate dehydrogenase [Halobacillus naozhouensis]
MLTISVTVTKEKEVYSVTGNEELGSFPLYSQEEVDHSIQKANQAQKKWAKTEVYKRADILHDWADRLAAKKEQIGEMISKEVGKNRSSAVKEVVRTADLIRYTAEEGCRIHGDMLRGDSFRGGSSKKMAMVEREPLGVVLAISPFNYPVNLAASKIAPALMAGNAVVFKPASQGALSGQLMIEALLETELHHDTVQCITGKGSEIGDFLVTHPQVSMITFTGSTATGQSISKKANMIPVVLELGGKDPAIVLDDADLDLAADQIVSGAFSYSGQRCTAIKRVLVDEKVADKLSEKIAQKVDGLTVGNPEDDAVVTPLIDPNAADFVQGLIDDALQNGAELVTGNKREGNLIYPTLLDHVLPHMKVAWEEPFGPVLPIIRVQDEADLVSIANESDYGLQASVFTANVQKAMDIGAKLNVGSVQYNAKTERGPDHFPFLGAKNSGLGSQGIRRSIESMTRDKLFVLNM